MSLRLATLLTVFLLALPSGGGETKVAPKQQGKCDCCAQALTAQQAYMGAQLLAQQQAYEKYLQALRKRLQSPEASPYLPNPKRRQILKKQNRYWL